MASVWARILGEEAGEPFFARMDEIFAAGGHATLVALGEPAAVLAALRAEGYVLGIVTNDFGSRGPRSLRQAGPDAVPARHFRL